MMPAAPAAPAESPAAPGPSRLARGVRVVSLLDLGAVLLATGLLWIVSERTWWGTVLTFSPRVAFLAAPGFLLILALFTDRRSALVNLAAIALVAGPLMGGRVSTAALLKGGSRAPLVRIVSCNVNWFSPDFETVLHEIKSLEPDVVAFQEAPLENDLIGRSFPGWHSIHEDEYWLLSRFPLARRDLFASEAFGRPTVLTVRVDAPQGAFLLFDVHLTTARFGLLKLLRSSILDGRGPRALEAETGRRRAEAFETRANIDRNTSALRGPDRTALPVLIVGDFNTPPVSQLYREVWPDFTNAFNAAGFGFGYTAPSIRRRRWFDDVPWLRIDHILTDDHWSVLCCRIGHGRGSDHRLIWADVALSK